jgi:3-hydroxyisobutyrate dehydrogenase-like beta-hydroxyacid dehydrogenase
MDVGFIGLGHMGSGMARSLMRAGHDLRVWNRSPEPVVRLEADGARRVADPAEVFQGEAVFTMLADDHAVRGAILESGALERARPGVVHIMSSSISVAFSQELEQAHAKAGVAYVAAPVLGRPDVAAAGGLNVLVAGAPEAVERMQPLLNAIGKQVWPIGAAAHQAHLVKLALNFSLAAAIETMAEAFALVRGYGLDARIVKDVMVGTLFAAPAYRTYGDLIVEQRFEPALFKLPLGLKDVRLALEAGEAVHAPLPFASVIRDNFLEAIAHGQAEKDWSAVSMVAARRAGL